MKRQVIVIHGGDSYATQEEFLTDLMKKVVSLEWLRMSDWKSGLSAALGSVHDVLLPRMPNAQNAKYQEWKMWFEKFIPHMADGVLLVGHSLGGSFLTKYLSEEAALPVRIGALFVVAAPFDRDSGRALVEFNITTDLSALASQVDSIFLYHSTDDPVVECGELAKFQRLLPRAIVRVFSNRGHFLESEFPELLEDIRSVE